MRYKQGHYGYFVFTFLVSMPVVLWLVEAGLRDVTASSSSFVSAAGKGSALIGIAAYSLMPVLSMRHKFLANTFGGLDVLYRLHSKAGKISAFFILAHPLLLMLGGIMAGIGILDVWNWGSPLVLSGIFGLVSILVLTTITIYAHIKHQKWIIIHRLFGWLLPFLFAHALLANGQIVHNQALFIYMMLLYGAGMAAFFYRSIFGQYIIQKYRYVIAEVNVLTPLVTELVLKPLDIPINYTPGQFAYVSVESDVIDNEAHPYSFTTANNGPYVRFTIKQLGDDTAHVKQLKPGTKAYLEGPYGNFSLHNSKSNNQIWIAGGVGITPFLSMARSLSKRSKHKIKLFYAAAELQDAVFLKELIAIRKTIPDNFDVTIVNRQISGFVGIKTLQNEIDDLSTFGYLICGPPPMMKALKTKLIENGVPEDQIFTEEFSML